MEIKSELTFNEALEILGIPEYKERIINSNSHGELFHIRDYFVLATSIDGSSITKEQFASFFKEVVEWTQKNWERPESIYQHILKIFSEAVTIGGAVSN